MQRTLNCRFASSLALPFTLAASLLPACAEPACHGDCGDDDAEVDDTATQDTTDGGDGGSGAAHDYCGCMLVSCHETYHARWGEDHVESEMACLSEAGTLPEAGMDVDAGDFVECRLHYCDLAQSTDTAEDPDNCPKAIGDAVCA